MSDVVSITISTEEILLESRLANNSFSPSIIILNFVHDPV